MGASWYVEKGGKRTGPFTPAQLKELVASGRLQASDMVQNDGMEKPVLAGKVKGLFPASVGEPAAPAVRPVTVTHAQNGPKAAGGVGGSQKQVTGGSRNDASAGPPPPRSVNGSQGYQGGKKAWRLWESLLIGSCLVSTVAGVVDGSGRREAPRPGRLEGSTGGPERQTRKVAKQGVEPLKQGAESPSAPRLLDRGLLVRLLQGGLFSPCRHERDDSLWHSSRKWLQSEDQTEKGTWERVEGLRRLGRASSFVTDSGRCWFDMAQKDRYKEQQWFKGKQHGQEQRWNQSDKMLRDMTYVGWRASREL